MGFAVGEVGPVQRRPGRLELRALLVCLLLWLILSVHANAQPANRMPSLAELRVYADAMTPESRALVAPVAEAVAAVRAAQALLAPAKDDAERLRRLYALDQAPRIAMSGLAISQIAPDQRKATSSAVGAELMQVDQEILAELLRMVPAEGWFRRSVYGEEAATAAFTIVQHAGPEVQRRFLPILARLVPEGEVKPGAYAMMWDRLALSDGKLQRYGTQMRCAAGRWIAAPIEAPDGLDARRAELKLKPMADYVGEFAAMEC